MSQIEKQDNEVFEDYLRENNPLLYAEYTDRNASVYALDDIEPEFRKRLMFEINRCGRVSSLYASSDEDWAKEILSYRYPYGHNKGRTAVDLFLNDKAFCLRAHSEYATWWQFEFRNIIDNLLYLVYWTYQYNFVPKKRSVFQIGPYRGRRIEDVVRTDRLFCQKFMITPEPEEIMQWIDDRESVLAHYEFCPPSVADRIVLDPHTPYFTLPQECLRFETELVSVEPVEARKRYRAKRPNALEDDGSPMSPLTVRDPAVSSSSSKVETVSVGNTVFVDGIGSSKSKTMMELLKTSISNGSLAGIIDNLGVAYDGHPGHDNLKTFLLSQKPLKSACGKSSLFIRDIHGPLGGRVSSLRGEELMENLCPTVDVFIEMVVTSEVCTKDVCVEYRRKTGEILSHCNGTTKTVRGPVKTKHNPEMIISDSVRAAFATEA